MWYQNFIKFSGALGLAMVIAFHGNAIAGSQVPHKVQDLAYGVSLYHFFQKKYFTAITELLVAEHYQKNTSDDKNPSLLLGGLYLSYDLQKQSSDIFKQLVRNEAQSVPIHIKDQAHFLLGKNYFNEGLYAQAENEFASIKDGLLLDSEEEKLFYQNNLFLRNDDYMQAQKTLDYFSAKSLWKGYAQFNIASRLIQHPNKEKIEFGFELMESLSAAEGGHVEKRILRDKANLALAYVALRDGQSERSIAYFNNISLKGIETNKALLGVGWARYRENKFREAVIPWMHLASSQTESDLAVQEAFISIPYAFEKMQLDDQALHHYGLALDSYKFQLDETQQLLKFIKSSKFIGQLNPGSLGKEITSAANVIKNLNPLLTQYLLPFLSSNTFQFEAKTYLELMHLRYMLNHWQNNIPSLQMMLREKRKTYNNKLSKTMEDDNLKRVKVLTEKRNKLLDKIKKIEENNDAQQLASIKEREQLSLLNNSQSRFRRLKNFGEEDLSDAENKYKLLKGRLNWEIETDYPVRVWAVKRQLQQLNEAISKMNKTMASLKRAWKSAPADFSDFDKRIANKEAQIKKLKKKINSAIIYKEKHLRSMALEQLRLHRNQLKLYHDRALYAKARLYDALMERR